MTNYQPPYYAITAEGIGQADPGAASKQVMAQLTRLSQILAKLNEEHNNLETALSAVMLKPMLIASGEGKPAPELVPLAAELRAQGDKAERMLDHIDSMLKRLEL